MCGCPTGFTTFFSWLFFTILGRISFQHGRVRVVIDERVEEYTHG